MSYLGDDPVFGIILGLALIVFAPAIRRKADAGRIKRIAQLDEGAPEKYFEERRQLLAYPLRHSIVLRALGGFLVILGVGLLLL